MLGLRVSDFSNPPVEGPVVFEIQQTALKPVVKKTRSGLGRPKTTEVLANGLTRQQTEDIFFPKTNYADISQQAAQNTENEKRAQAEASSVRGRLRNSGLNQVFGEDGNRAAPASGWRSMES